jgi:glycosyltransferase involved in cell wall biosynthesis
MDVFAFPSHTDTYGNVVLEALASGVPALVTDKGGPRFIVKPGETGFVASDLQGFVTPLLELAGQPEKLKAMRIASRTQAEKASWDKVFELVYASYDRGLNSCCASGKKIRLRAHSAVCI